jgi:hypothetical protein
MKACFQGLFEVARTMQGTITYGGGGHQLGPAWHRCSFYQALKNDYLIPRNKFNP